MNFGIGYGKRSIIEVNCREERFHNNQASTLHAYDVCHISLNFSKVSFAAERA